MATPSRLRGNIRPIFTIKATGDVSPISYADDLKKVGIKADDKDAKDLTFAEAAAGETKDWTLTATIVVSFDAGALYAALWDPKVGDAEIVWGPWGNAVPSATKPHFKMPVTLPGPVGLETEARLGSDPAGAEVEVTFQGTGPVVKVVA